MSRHLQKVVLCFLVIAGSRACPVDVKLQDLTGPIYGYPGSVPNAKAFYTYVHGVSNNYTPQKLQVKVTDQAGNPATKCKVDWRVNKDAGWVFPTNEGLTDPSGITSAWFVVGTANSGVTVTVRDQPEKQLVLKLTDFGIAQPLHGDNIACAASYFKYDTPGTADEVVGTMEPMTDVGHQPFPHGTYFSFMAGAGYYLGVVSNPRRILFSIWTRPDGKTKVYSVGKYAKCPFSHGEGDHIGCNFEHDSIANEEITYYVKKVKMPDGMFAISLDVKSNAHPFNGKRLHFAAITMRYQDTTFQDAGGFIEQYLRDPGARNCLELMPRYMKLSDVKYHVIGEPADQYHKATKLTYWDGVGEKWGHVCANYFYGRYPSGSAVLLGIGGPGTNQFPFSEPFGNTLNYENGLYKYKSKNERVVPLLFTVTETSPALTGDVAEMIKPKDGQPIGFFVPKSASQTCLTVSPVGCVYGPDHISPYGYSDTDKSYKYYKDQFVEVMARQVSTGKYYKVKVSVSKVCALDLNLKPSVHLPMTLAVNLSPGMPYDGYSGLEVSFRKAENTGLPKGVYEAEFDLGAKTLHSDDFLVLSFKLALNL